jgi:ABC-type long-subunit fatty acid transport system fused permease/ATPase subunit
MNRSVLAASFFISCILFAILAVWFWLQGNKMVACILIAMIPMEIAAFLLVDRTLRQGGS